MRALLSVPGNPGASAGNAGASAWHAIVGDVDAVMRGDAILAGRASRDLVQRVKACRSEAQRMQVR